MKTKSLIPLAASLGCALIAFVSCSKDLSNNVRHTELKLDDNYQYDFQTSEMVTLGRVLFYDQSLSVNNAVSCGSCHKQVFAFADNKRLSEGFENFVGTRNTPPIQNLSTFSLISFSPNGFGGQALFWDGREPSLLDMVTQPVFNHVEMGIRNPSDLVKRVQAKSYYKELFRKAFHDDEISLTRISEGLMAFVGNITSNRSKFDQSMMNSALPGGFTAPEQRGFDLFFGKYNCGSCHNLQSPSGYFIQEENGQMVNIGLDANYADPGRGDISGNPADNGKFKIPNLRNVAITGPYMHDGRFTTLEEVMDHYSIGIQSHPNLDARLKDPSGNALVLNISQAEKQDMIAFLHTLTDNGLLTDPKFSDPFVKR
jgi:cytochrome c peroxidase